MLFSDMLNDVSGFLPGCPAVTIQGTLRKLAIDLCERGDVWQEDLAGITLVDGTRQYTPVSPYAYAEISNFTDAYIIDADANKVLLTWAAWSTVRRVRPQWPQDDAGQPMFYLSEAPGLISLAPVPDADSLGTLYVRASLRPTATATEFPAALYPMARRVLFHGTLHELMLMPERSWSNEKVGTYHGKMWTSLLHGMAISAQRDYNPGGQSVQMIPFA
jgi:hypothetical protein